MSEQAVGRRKKDRHSARARYERGVSIWTEIRMRAEAEFVTERVKLCDQFKRNDSYIWSNLRTKCHLDGEGKPPGYIYSTSEGVMKDPSVSSSR